MTSNHEQWQAWVALKNSGRVGRGAAPPICKQNESINVIKGAEKCDSADVN